MKKLAGCLMGLIGAVVSVVGLFLMLVAVGLFVWGAAWVLFRIMLLLGLV